MEIIQSLKNETRQRASIKFVGVAFLSAVLKTEAKRSNICEGRKVSHKI